MRGVCGASEGWRPNMPPPQPGSELGTGAGHNLLQMAAGAPAEVAETQARETVNIGRRTGSPLLAGDNGRDISNDGEVHDATTASSDRLP
jgi:hypothetical protein